MIKLFTLGELPGQQSITVFHALARLDVECLIVASPRDPIVSIGYFEEAAEAVDLDFCEKHDIPVMRREVGGGTTYLDRNQVFYQLILRKRNPIIPLRIADRYRLFSEPPIQTYRRFGIEAAFKPINDLCTREGRKIAGEAGGDIGQCIVFVGGILLDFDYLTASRIIRVPDQAFRDMVSMSMKKNITSMKRQLGEAPQKKEVESALIEEYDKLLGPLEPAELTPAMRKLMDKLEHEFTAATLGSKNRPSPRREVKVAEGVKVVQRLHEGIEGATRVTMEVKNNTVVDIAIFGDPAFLPKDKLWELERALKGLQLDDDALRRVADEFCEQNRIRSGRASIRNLLETIPA